jgi:hypothetical protein
MTAGGKTRILIGAIILGYVAMIAAIVIAMISWRQSIITVMSDPDSQASWNDWRAEAAKEDGAHGPVQRTIPKSPEPPMLVLMRDYFPGCLMGLLIPSSALYAVIAWMACGVARQSSTDKGCLGSASGGSAEPDPSHTQ